MRKKKMMYELVYLEVILLTEFPMEISMKFQPAISFQS